MRVNQIGVTIYDNKPDLPANKWYEVTDIKTDVKNRYKIELNFLHKGSPIKLRSSLVWPPNQLRRLSYWENNKDFYENCVNQAHELNSEIRSGRMSAQIPALIGMPNMNESFQTADKRRHFKWVLPQKVSAIIAVRQIISPGYFQWRIRWTAPGFEHEFILPQDCRADDIAGRRGESVRIYKAFPGPHNIDDSLISADYSNTNYIVRDKTDEAYEEFKRRVQYLYDMKKDDESKAVMNQFPEYTERWVKEGFN
jgi:hypothetical protein